MMTAATRRQLRWFFEQARTRRLRSMRQFAQTEVVLPSGPFAGRRFDCERQPFTRLLLDAIDSGIFNRVVATGPTQSGKTLCCFVLPILYHLFEIGETVIAGVPDMDMAADKWSLDLLPVIERSRYRALLPRLGRGSRGGRVDAIRFGNGATLKFMSGGGSDKSRAGFTARVLVITETDGMDMAANNSREADRITQLEARTRAFGQRRRIYMECTASTEAGRIWQEYIHGTRSRIALCCPLCRGWVSPERQHLLGWQQADSELAARHAAAFVCPACQRAWSQADRVQANRQAILLHGDQQVDAGGAVVGEQPPTQTLGFRWSAVNNMLLEPGDLAVDEWQAARASDEENAQRAMLQFVWCQPVKPAKLTDTPLELQTIAARTSPVKRSVVPPDSTTLTLGVDLGKYLAHWIAVAWQHDATCHVVDYGRIEVPSDGLAIEQAVQIALDEVKQIAEAGWPKLVIDGDVLLPQQVFIDAGFMTEVVYDFCRRVGTRYRPTVGRGAAQQKPQWHQRVTQTGSTVAYIGEGYHAAWLPAAHLHLVEIDADYWKSWVHQRLSTAIGKIGAMTLFEVDTPQDYYALARHLTAETRTEQFIAGKGVITRWERIRKQNHWLDALYLACVAAHSAGVRLGQGRQDASDEASSERSGQRSSTGRMWIDRDHATRWMTWLRR